MVERCRVPCVRGVALAAICAKASTVRIVLGMAAITRGWEPREYIVDMAIRTCNRSVCAGQRESGGIVIERGWLPAVCGMTAFAVGAQLSIMRIIPRMAGMAIGWRPLERFGGVTFFARDYRMPSQQSEADRIVVECGGLPACRGMALGTGCTQLAGMDIVLCMARVAFRGRTFEQFIGMTLFAWKVCMLAI